MSFGQSLPFNQKLNTTLVNGRLVGIHVEYVVIGECFVFSKYDLCLPWCANSAHATQVDLLACILRPNAARRKAKQRQTRQTKKSGQRPTRQLTARLHERTHDRPLPSHKLKEKRQATPKGTPSSPAGLPPPKRSNC